MNKLQQLTKAIQEAVPEIMKRDITLEDCLIAIPGENSEIRKNKYKCEDCGYVGTDGTLSEESNGKYFVIEGAHISGFYHKCPKCKYGQGDILTRFWNSEVIKIIKLWKLNTPLHQQEQETIDLLWDLIE